MTEKHICPLAKFSKHKTDEHHCNQQCGASIAVQARYEAAGIPEGYRGIYMDDNPVSESQTKVFEALDKYVETFHNPEVRIKNVFLYSSNVGTGKTHTAISLLNEYIRRRFLMYAKEGRQIPETIGYFLDVTAWQNEYNMAAMSGDQNGMAKIASDIKRLSEIEMVVFDDIAVRSVSEALGGYIHTIINARNVAGLPTIFTSNIPMEDVNQVFDKRTYEQERYMTVQLHFGGESKRGIR